MGGWEERPVLPVPGQELALLRIRKTRQKGLNWLEVGKGGAQRLVGRAEQGREQGGKGIGGAARLLGEGEGARGLWEEVGQPVEGGTWRGGVSWRGEGIGPSGGSLLGATAGRPTQHPLPLPGPFSFAGRREWTGDAGLARVACRHQAPHRFHCDGR